MKKTFTYLFFSLWIVNISFGQKSEMAQGWIEKGYLNCIKNKLPCECFRWSSPPLYINYSINSNDSSFLQGYRIVNFQNNEHISFDLKSIHTEISNIIDSTYIAHIEINKKNLLYYFFKDSSQYVYVPIDGNFWTITDSLGIKQINEKLIQNEHPDLHKILKSDSLECHCDTQLSYNYITSSNSDNNNESWIVEINKNEIVLYKLKALRIKRFTEYRKSHFPHKLKVYKRFKLNK